VAQRADERGMHAPNHTPAAPRASWALATMPTRRAQRPKPKALPHLRRDLALPFHICAGSGRGRRGPAAVECHAACVGSSAAARGTVRQEGIRSECLRRSIRPTRCSKSESPVGPPRHSPAPRQRTDERRARGPRPALRGSNKRARRPSMREALTCRPLLRSCS
jgi:hypothetical protein